MFFTLVVLITTDKMSYINKQEDAVLLTTPIRSEAIPVDKLTGHNSTGQTYTGLPDVIAVVPSRLYHLINIEWSLHVLIAMLIWELWGLHSVDMCGTIHNSQRWWMLSQPWQGWLMYMFPPFHLLNNVCQKGSSTICTLHLQEADLLKDAS